MDAPCNGTGHRIPDVSKKAQQVVGCRPNREDVPVC